MNETEITEINTIPPNPYCIIDEAGFHRPSNIKIKLSKDSNMYQCSTPIIKWCARCKKDVRVRDTGARYVCIFCGEWCREEQRA